jgi:hypothetical protein
MAIRLKALERENRGTFFVDSCNAIKLSIDRPNISASLDEHDVFGAQQQSAVERLEVPVYAVELAKASSFERYGFSPVTARAVAMQLWDRLPHCLRRRERRPSFGSAGMRPFLPMFISYSGRR